MWLNPGPGIWGAGGRVPSMTDSQRGFRAQRKQNLARQNFMNGGLLAITAREIQNMCQCNAICMHSSLFLHTEHNLSFFKKNIKIYSGFRKPYSETTGLSVCPPIPTSILEW